MLYAINTTRGGEMLQGGEAFLAAGRSFSRAGRSKSLQKSLHLSSFVDFLREVFKKVYDPADL
jgi:hypothetical protein